MSKPNSQTNQKMTNDKFWQFRNLAGDDQKAELLLYGDISERGKMPRPRNGLRMTLPPWAM